MQLYEPWESFFHRVRYCGYFVGDGVGWLISESLLNWPVEELFVLVAVFLRVICAVSR